ncbi:MAG: hypothetical protein EZS28_051955 [Streblomastix strix]|uniref:Uncharacterized protein n=1 Tax=Streblomastix strix TaxID=222440 RepID=A0A5J4SS00_9EUKA|nr:MAG: hypothetical protein EZS28_051955 [Streblomastix strix]
MKLLQVKRRLAQLSTQSKQWFKTSITILLFVLNVTQDDALLLLKADKTQLIDAYIKTEIDALIDDKLNITDQIDAQIKGEDEALLLLKADRTQLIDSYTKGEADSQLNNKANSGVSYTKGEDDSLVLLIYVVD